MKQILTHKSRSIADVVELLKTGTFTCPTLPHYRYMSTKNAAKALKKAGMLRQTGKTSTSVSYVASDYFKKWKYAYESGMTKLQPIKWAKIDKQIEKLKGQLA